jgi:hypothetical protein
MGSLARVLLTLGGFVAVGYLAWGVLGPNLPVSKPVTVRGGDKERSLAEAVEDFDPSQIVTVIGKDGIPAIDDPRLVPAPEADLGEEDLVIGVEIDGEARAYPIRVLSSHEIVNDEIRGQPYAVTW